MGQEASQLAQANQHLSDRVINTFHAIDANGSGSLSVSEVCEFFRHADHLKGEEAQIEAAHHFFYTINTHKDEKISLNEYKQFFIRKLDEDGLEQTKAMLELIEGLIPKVQHSKEYHRLSSLSRQEENRAGKVEVALVALTEAQTKLKAGTSAEYAFLGAVNAASDDLMRAQHELKADSKMDEVDANVQHALDALSEAKTRLKEEAKLEAAAEAALQDAVNALDDARAEMKGDAKLDQGIESAALRAVDQASNAIAVTKHKLQEEKKMEEELEEAIEATRQVISGNRHDSEAKVESALENAVRLTQRALDDAKLERRHGSMTERQIEEASHLIVDAELRAES
jgi:hypothetical protein